MDFTKGLANLQRSANAAAASRQQQQQQQNTPNNNNNDGRRDYHNHTFKRHKREHHHSNGRRGGRNQQRRHRDDSSEEMELKRLVESIRPYDPTLCEGQGYGHDRRRHVALLVLSIDDLPFEHLWRAWIDGVGCNDDYNNEKVLVSVICHAKFPDRVRSSWLQRRLLVQKQGGGRKRRRGGGKKDHDDDAVRYHSRRPEWGSVEITRAMIDLMEEGLRIGAGAGAGAGDEKGVNDEEEEEEEEDERYCTSRYLGTEVANNEDEEDDVDNGGWDDEEGAASSEQKATPPPSEGSTRKKKKRFHPPPVDCFVFVSETCIPVATLNEFESAVYVSDVKKKPSLSSPIDENDGEHKDNHENESKTNHNMTFSWLHASNRPNNGYARQLQWDRISENVLPPRNIWKSDQWILVNRFHALSVCDAGRIAKSATATTETSGGRSGHHKFVELWRAFRNVKASDEMYFPSVMSLLGIIRLSGKGEDDNKDIGDQVLKRRITYCDWSQCDKNPASFDVSKASAASASAASASASASASGSSTTSTSASKNSKTPKLTSAQKVFEAEVKTARKEGCLFARKFIYRKSFSSSSSDDVGDEFDKYKCDDGCFLTADVWEKVMKKNLYLFRGLST